MASIDLDLSGGHCASTVDRETLRLETMRLDFGNCNHTVLVQDSNFDSHLWKRLPESLVEEVLAKLPFSSLVRLCTVCKRWKDLILSSPKFPRCTSSHKRLLFYHGANIKVFSPTRGMFETMSLRFLTKEVATGITIQSVVASSSSSGLLCFSTSRYGQLIVCNPLTKCCKQVQVPYRDAYGDASTLRTGDLPCLPVENYLYTRLERPRRACGPDYLLKSMVVDSCTGHFKLIVAGLPPNIRGGTTLVYDSRVDTWKEVAPLPANALPSLKVFGNIQTTVTECGRNVYFYPGDGGNFRKEKIFKYDLENEAWSSILIPKYEGMSRTAILLDCNGKLLWVRSSFGIDVPKKLSSPNLFQVFELQDHEGSKSTPWVSTDCLGLPLSKISEGMTGLFFIRRHLPSSSMWIVSLTVAEIGPSPKSPASPSSSHYFEKFSMRTCLFNKDETSSLIQKPVPNWPWEGMYDRDETSSLTSVLTNWEIDTHMRDGGLPGGWTFTPSTASVEGGISRPYLQS